MTADMIHHKGPLLCSPHFCLGYPQGRGPLHLQILPGGGGQETPKGAGEDVRQGAPGEARVIKECKYSRCDPERCLDPPTLFSHVSSRSCTPSVVFFLNIEDACDCYYAMTDRQLLPFCLTGLKGSVFCRIETTWEHNLRGRPGELNGKGTFFAGKGQYSLRSSTENCRLDAQRGNKGMRVRVTSL